MKSIDVESDLYRYIASQTESIGEDASSILRRLLGLPSVGEIVIEGPLKDPAEVRDNAISLSKSEESLPLKVISNDGVDCFDKLILPEEISEYKAAVGRFLFLLNKLHSISQDNFEQVLSISGRDRVYFAKDEKTLLGANASTKPKRIGETQYWVITNSNTSKKRAMLAKALEVLGCNAILSKEITDQI